MTLAPLLPRLTTLPLEMGSLRQLKDVNFAMNKIERVPDTIR